jgi:hypothetical protein
VYEEASPVLKVMRGSFHHHYFGGDLSAWVVYKMGIVRYKHSSPQNNPQHTTNTQQQDEPPPPYPQAALPSIFMATAATAPAVGSALPMDPGQAQGAWLLLAVLAGSHLGHQNKPHQKIERKMVHRP